MVLVAFAMALRVVLNVLDCFKTAEQIEKQNWRNYVIYYIDIMFMAINLQLIFRVVGSWTIFARIQSEPNSIFTKDYNQQVHSLNSQFLWCQIAYSLLCAQLIILKAYYQPQMKTWLTVMWIQSITCLSVYWLYIAVKASTILK